VHPAGSACAGRRAESVACSGPEIFLPSQQALHVALVLHELGTNARKYGALSVPHGRLDVSWTVSANGSGSSMELNWTERDGPEVCPLNKGGFGTTLIEHSLKSFGAETAMHFEPLGLRCTIRLPLAADYKKSSAWEAGRP
jgi:two-component sensor histidine kinase